MQTNKLRQEQKEELSPEELKKHELIEKVVNELTDNGIKFYLFPLLKAPKYKKDVVWQWNSLVALADFDKSGKLTEESCEKIKLFNALMFTQLFTIFTIKGESFSEDFDKFCSFIYSCIAKGCDYINEEKDKGVDN